MRVPSFLAVCVGIVLAACSGADSAATGFTLTEFVIDGPGALPPGSSLLSVENVGEFPHTLVIADETGRVVTASDLIQPGETDQLEVDLSSGTYQFTCRIVAEKPDGELVDHFEEGMVETVRVADGSAKEQA